MPGVTAEDARAVAVGVAGSLAAWSMLQRVRVPYDWSPQISERLPTATDPSRYAVKVRRRQSERWLPRKFRRLRRLVGFAPREVVDVRLHFVLRFTGVSPSSPRNVRNVPIPSRDWLPYVRIDRVLPLNPARVDPHERVRLPESIQRLLETPGVTIRDVLEAPGYKVRLQAHLVGYDSFSGSRCVYSSREWSAADIKRGTFRIKGLDIVPWDSAMAADAYAFGED